MAEKLMTDGSMALREKQYRVITIEATEKPQNAKLRVAAYARVSSASDDQLNSFAAQNLSLIHILAYLSERGYSIVRHPLLGNSLAPLCCLMARKIPDERTAARQTAVRSAQLDHIKVKEE